MSLTKAYHLLQKIFLDSSHCWSFTIGDTNDKSVLVTQHGQFTSTGGHGRGTLDRGAGKEGGHMDGHIGGRGNRSESRTNALIAPTQPT